jgi:protein SCO1
MRAVGYSAVAIVLLLAGFGAGLFVARSRPGSSALPDLGPAPHYTLTNQLGRSVSSTQFAGKIRIVTFLFPYCTTYCPLIAAHLIGFEHLLAQSHVQDRVEVVAFNVAPAAVGPKQMSEFLQQYGWNPANPHWQFLTGTPAEIRHVVTGGYHVAYQRVADTGSDAEVVLSDQAPQLAVANPLAERVKPDFDISHNDAIEIVDGRGRIRKIYDDADVVSGRQLWRDLGPLLKD